MNWYKFSQEIAEKWNKFPNRQRFLPFMNQKDNPYRRKVPLDYYEDEYSNDALYHVTTNLPGVIKAMKLKSRSELDGQNVGLGGGYQNEAPDKVSLTFNYQKAFDIYGDLHYVVSILQNKVSASDIYGRLSNYAIDAWEEDMLNSVEQVANDFGVPKDIILTGNDTQFYNILNKNINTAEKKYEFFKMLESAIAKEDLGKESPIPLSISGFTSDFSAMKKINPNNIAIIQCVLRKNAVVEDVPMELEIRANPEDLAIIRYMKPSL